MKLLLTFLAKQEYLKEDIQKFTIGLICLGYYNEITCFLSTHLARMHVDGRVNSLSYYS